MCLRTSNYVTISWVKRSYFCRVKVARKESGSRGLAPGKLFRAKPFGALEYASFFENHPKMRDIRFLTLFSEKIMKSTRRNSRLILEKLYVATFRGLESFKLAFFKARRLEPFMRNVKGNRI